MVQSEIYFLLNAELTPAILRIQYLFVVGNTSFFRSFKPNKVEPAPLIFHHLIDCIPVMFQSILLGTTVRPIVLRYKLDGFRG